MFRYSFKPALLLIVFTFAAAAARSPAAELIPREQVRKGGLCVIIGDAEWVESNSRPLLDAAPWVIHGLDSDGERVDRARQSLMQQHIYGRVTVEVWAENHLPYADSLTNLIVVFEDEMAVDRDELLRVLAPGGTALIAAAGEVEHLRKPRPPEMGEWTHPGQGPEGSLASTDRALEPPNAFQWIGAPGVQLGGRKSSTLAMFSAGGKLIILTSNVADNLPSGNPRHLLVRDGFNGVLLWSHPGPWWGSQEAMVADSGHIYAVKTNSDSITVFDNTDGSIVDRWEVNSASSKLLLEGRRLVVQSEYALKALDTDSGELLWEYPAEQPWGTLLSDGQAFFLESTREKDGRWHHKLVSVELDNGAELWQRPLESIYSHRDNPRLRLHFAGGGAVCLIERTKVRFLSTDDGRDLWHRESDTEARLQHDSRQVGHFFVDGLVWFRQTRARGGLEAPETWVALDPLTGQEQRELTVTGPQGLICYGPGGVNKLGCQRLTASARFVLDGRLSTIWDFETGEREGYKFVRGTCDVGVVPANGLAYVGPNSCGCLAEQVRGYSASGRIDGPGLRSDDPGPLEKGPAYGRISGFSAENGSWPAYRGDIRRSAHLPGSLPLPGALEPRWETKLDLRGTDPDDEWHLLSGQPLTQPVIAGGLAVVAEPRAHTVTALDRETGEEVWRFIAGGRISVPPAAYNGIMLFGAHDGYVYALRAEDGKLIWRRRAAPSDRRIVVYGQLESAWPVKGGVLVHSGMALAAAGRAADAGGGFLVHAFDPETGEKHWSRRVRDARYGVGDPLVANDEYVYMMDKRFDPLTGAVTDLPFDYRLRESPDEPASVSYPEGIHYLRGGKTGLLEASWTRINNALRRGQSVWNWGTSEGEVLAYADERVYSYQVTLPGKWPRMGGGDRDGGVIEARGVAGADKDWALTLDAPLQVESMLVTEDTLFLAGPLDYSDPRGPGFLHAISRNDGAGLSDKYQFHTAPVFDGLAAAGDEIFVALRDGTLICLGAGDNAPE